MSAEDAPPRAPVAAEGRARFGLLGPVEVTGSAGEHMLLGSRQGRAVLAMLLLARGRVVSVEQLVDGLWSWEPPATSARSVHALVSRLRAALAPMGVALDSPSYALELQPGDLDLARFEDLVASSRRESVRGQLGAARRALTEALDLWRGPALADVITFPFAPGPAASMHELREQAVEDLVDVRLQLGEHPNLIPELEDLVSLQPLRERRWAQLMLTYYRNERQAEALAAFQRARARLVGGLGLEPGAALRQMERSILDHEPALAGPTSLPSPGAPPSDWISVREATATARWAPLRPPLVGRQRELKQLDDTLDAAAAGRRSAVAIDGEPGIGKTRLAQELSSLAARRGAEVAWGRCYSAEASAPYRPALAALRELLAGMPPDWVEEALGPAERTAAALLPELASTPGRRPRVGDRLAAFDGVASLLSKLSRRGPILLVIDDVQWADQSSLALLLHIARHVHGSRVLLAVTYRSSEVGPSHPLQAWLEQLDRELHLVRVQPEALLDEEVVSLVAAIQGTRAARASSLAIAAQTGGNPLFVREVAEYQLERGPAAGPSDAIPPGVLGMLGARLETLTPTCRKLCGVIAVSAGSFPFELARRASDIPEEEALAALDEAMAARVLRERKEGGTVTVSFTHPLLRRAALTGISGTRACGLHARIAEVLALWAGDDEEQWIGYLALHAYLAGREHEPERAAAACARAGELALTQGAFDEAATHFEHALEAMGWCAPRTGAPVANDRLLSGLVRARSGARASGGNGLRAEHTGVLAPTT